MMNERRCYKSRGVDTSVELRAAADGSKSLVGAAAVFQRYSQNLGGFVEVLAPEAFTPALQRGSNVAGLVNHDPSWLLATTGSGTLTLAQDGEAFRYLMALDMADPDAQRAAAKIGTGKMPGSSFSFRVAPGGDSWSQTEQGFPLRTIRAVDELFDVGPVTFPAYLDTQGDTAATALRSLAEQIDRPLEDLIAAARSNELRSFIPVPAKVFVMPGTPEARDVTESNPHPLTPRQAAIDAAMESVVEVFGQFDQTSGPDGAHYMAPSPFADLKCANCAFYDGMRACELVAGDIDPDAVCKLWLIPGDLVAADVPADPSVASDGQTMDLGTGAGLPTRSVTPAAGRTAYLERRAALDALA